MSSTRSAVNLQSNAKELVASRLRIENTTKRMVALRGNSRVRCNRAAQGLIETVVEDRVQRRRTDLDRAAVATRAGRPATTALIDIRCALGNGNLVDCRITGGRP